MKVKRWAKVKQIKDFQWIVSIWDVKDFTPLMFAKKKKKTSIMIKGVVQKEQAKNQHDELNV